MRVLFLYSRLPSFVRRDLEILQKHFEVGKVRIASFKKPLAYWRLLKAILKNDVVYCWSATWRAFFVVLFSMVFRKKSIVVVTGYEVAYEPNIGYGLLVSCISRLKVKFVLKHASKILTVSKSSTAEMLRFTEPKNFKMVYNGVDVEKFKPSGSKECLVITVGAISESKIKKKRFDIFVKASRHLPDVQFLLIGAYEDNSVERLRKMAGSNVNFTGYVSDDQLLHYYQKAKVYCQLSTQESFGVALAEAMACACVPVVVNRYSLPELVGNTGFYVPYNDAEATAQGIKNALQSNKGKKGRERIVKHFSLALREKALVTELVLP